MSFQTIDVKTLTPHIGAEIEGVDLSTPLSNQQFSEVYQAWLDWKVLVFRDQHLDRDQHKAFARRFGSLHVHPMQHSYGGGDTLFADMYLAYELLSDTMKNMLAGLTAVHDGALPYVGGYGVAPPDGTAYPRNEHPVVISHAETGNKILYVNSGFTSHIKDLNRWESQMLLKGLTDYIATTQRLYCRVQWEPNTLTFWDNRCTQHHSVWDYYPHSRYGERVSILGDVRPAV